MNAEKHKRLRELTDLIATERDHDEFTKLVAKLNQLLDEEKSHRAEVRPN